MPFLTPNQQRQSTEGTELSYTVVQKTRPCQIVDIDQYLLKLFKNITGVRFFEPQCIYNMQSYNITNLQQNVDLFIGTACFHHLQPKTSVVSCIH